MFASHEKQYCLCQHRVSRPKRNFGHSTVELRKQMRRQGDVNTSQSSVQVVLRAWHTFNALAGDASGRGAGGQAFLLFEIEPQSVCNENRAVRVIRSGYCKQVDAYD
jgi:hypothetical protein